MVPPNTTTPCIKAVLVGPMSSGKTLLLQWLRMPLRKSQVRTYPTIGASFSIIPQTRNDGTVVNWHTWDVSGSPVYKTMYPLYTKSSDVIIFVYPLSLPESERRIEAWFSPLNIQKHTRILTIETCSINVGPKRNNENEIGVNLENGMGVHDVLEWMGQIEPKHTPPKAIPRTTLRYIQAGSTGSTCCVLL